MVFNIHVRTYVCFLHVLLTTKTYMGQLLANLFLHLISVPFYVLVRVTMTMYGLIHGFVSCQGFLNHKFSNFVHVV